MPPITALTAVLFLLPSLPPYGGYEKPALGGRVVEKNHKSANTTNKSKNNSNLVQ